MRKASTFVPWFPALVLVLAASRGGTAGADPLELSQADRAAIAALAPGAAQGELVVDGRKATLAHAYAVVRTPLGREVTTIVLSDVPVAADVLLSTFGLQRLAADGKVHAVEVDLEADRSAGSGQLHHDAFAAKPGGFSASVSLSGPHRFLPAPAEGSDLAGKLLMPEPSRMMDSEFHYAGVFRASLLRRPPPTHEGEAAARSGPGKAVTAFLRAGRSGQKAALRRLMDPEMAAQLDGPDGAEMLGMLKELASPGMKVVEVTENGDSAEVVAVKHDKDGRETLKFRTLRIGDEWRIGVRRGP